jgi:hypothetical protein
MHFSTVKYEGYSESNLWCAVNKRSNEEETILLYAKNMYIHKLFLNIVITRIEARVILGNKFL